MIENLRPSYELARLAEMRKAIDLWLNRNGDPTLYGAGPFLVDVRWLLADHAALESELAQTKAELDFLRTWKRSVDEALNSGDGTYRP